MPFTERLQFAATPEPTPGPSALVVSYLRTFVPIWWGALVTWLLARVPGVDDFLAWFGVDLEAPAAAGVATSVVIALWYAAWRWAEPRLPDWATRLVLGSAKAPAYGVPARDVGTAYVRILPVDPPADPK